MEQATDDLTVQRRGSVLIFDCSRYSLSNLSLLTLEDVRRGTGMWTNSFPCRLKRVFVVGLSHAARSTIAMFLNLLVPTKIRARVVMVPGGAAGDAVLEEGLGRGHVPLSLRDMAAAQGEWRARVRGHLAGQPLLPPLSDCASAAASAT
mmetsp:Transcript_7108/g.17947  ORF Transcript_7108/g.17947 Transcript_7108/m.17947 type:complete len:149 (-) Transcript_7108:45-491(-)